jgi:phosphohistidine phosphatase SixA
LALFLVRHAKAGSRQRWAGDDVLRPLSNRGARQAKALVALLEPYGVGNVRRVVSSPYVRCVETVAPLAEQLGLKIEVVEELAEGHGPEALALARSWLGEEVAACSHGDVVPFVVGQLVHDAPDPLPCAKGSTWILRAAGERVTGRHVPPA